MGRQINYYMEYESFLRLAEKALELGCEIIRRAHEKEVGRGFSTDVITPDETFYYFRVPEAGDITVKTDMNGNQYADSAGAAVNCLIEAGFSGADPAEKRLYRERLYSSTGYYDADGTFVGRPDCVTQIYNTLVRYAKKLAPYTELTDIRTDAEGVPHTRKQKQYISPHCLRLRSEGYALK